MALTSTGLDLSTTEEIREEIETEEAAALGDEVETGPTSPLGEINAIFANQIRVVGELAGAVYASFDPEQASGAALERVCALTGTYRRAATNSTVEVAVTCSDGTSLAAGKLILAVAGATSRRFVNVDAVENSSGGEDTVTATFKAEETGPVEAPAGTLTVLAEAASGFVSSTNAADATLGRVEETDVQLRARRESELSRAGTSTPDAIRVDILDAVVDDDGEQLLVDVIVFENRTDETDVNGLPPHSIEVLVYDGTSDGSAATDAAIAAAVWAAKPAGIETYGTTTESVTDARGDAQSVKFTRPTAVEVDIEVTIDTGADYTSAVDDAIKSALVTYGQDQQDTGGDVVHSRLYVPILGAVEVPGEVYSVTLLRMRRDADPFAAADVDIETREIAVIDTANITIITV